MRTLVVNRLANKLSSFVNTNQFIKSLDRQYDSEFGKSGAKIGSQLRIRLPNDYTVRTGVAAQIQDTAEQQVVLTMATQQGVDVSFTTADLYLSLDDFSERVLLPMMNDLAGGVATNIMSNNALAICNMDANLDANGDLLTPSSGTYLQAQATLANNSTPQGMKQRIVNSPRTEARVVNSLTGLLNPAAAISEQYYDGQMYDALGALWYHDQTVISATTGTLVSGTVDGADQTGTTLTVAALGGTMAVGDIFTIAGVDAVNRVTKQTTGELRQFVITVAAAANATSISFYPSIVPAVGGNAQQYQTVDVSPADGAVFTPYLPASTTYRNNFRYAPQAITMATGDLPIPNNVKSARHSYDNVSMRAVTQYQIGTDQEITRIDVLYGSLTIRPEWGSRLPDVV